MGLTDVLAATGRSVERQRDELLSLRSYLMYVVRVVVEGPLLVDAKLVIWLVTIIDEVDSCAWEPRERKSGYISHAYACGNQRRATRARLV